MRTWWQQNVSKGILQIKNLCNCITLFTIFEGIPWRGPRNLFGGPPALERKCKQKDRSHEHANRTRHTGGGGTAPAF